MILSHLHDVLFLPFEIAADYILPLSAFFLLVFSFLREFTRYAVFKVRWWAQMESNHRPHAYQACALTI